MTTVMKKLLINSKLVNEGEVKEVDVLIEGERILRIDSGIAASLANEVIDLEGRHILPGLIDDQVHFREPGLTHKGSIATESRAAICGGVTSILEMPNTSPPTTDKVALAKKLKRAEGRSFANYAFYLGATNDNLEEIKRIALGDACGIKVFMGASTGNMLVDDTQVLEKIFAESPLLIATHCEDSPTIWANEESFRKRFGEDVPMEAHPEIRSAEACYKSSSLAVDLAKQYGTRLHVLHLSTARELELFEPGPISEKSITAEVCTHHLWFDQSRYKDLGSLIKCNPAIKSSVDRDGLMRGVCDDLIDVILTAMPNAEVHRPSIGLGQLKSSLTNSGISAKIVYGNLQYYEFLGPDLYLVTTGSARTEDGLTDWLFGPAAFPDFVTDETEYLDLLFHRNPLLRYLPAGP